MKVGTENLSFHSFIFLTCKLKLTRDQQLIMGDRERNRRGIELFTVQSLLFLSQRHVSS